MRPDAAGARRSRSEVLSGGNVSGTKLPPTLPEVMRSPRQRMSLSLGESLS